MTEPQQQGLRTVGAWALGSHIGAGSFAIVWRARHTQTGQEAAVKEIALSKLNAKLRQSLESEVAILKRIRHENIVQLLEVIEEADRLYLVMEYCAGGDLAHLLRAVKRLPEAAAQHLMRQLAAGLRQMWTHHLVHRDLKPQNLLLSEASPDATLKIADFGFARNLQPQGLAETLCGSPLYMAPEILHFHKYDAKADLWSIGAILYELVVGRPPFTGANQFQLLRNIERSEARLPEALAAQLSPHCRHLIHCLLRRNPVERLSFEEFFRHPFVATPEEAAAPLPPRAPFGSAAASLAAAAVAAAAGGLGAHTAAGGRGGSTRAVSPQGPSRSASAEGSLAGSRHAYASAEEDVFAVHPAAEGHAAAPAAPPAWLGAPRWRFLQRVAHVLRHAADARQTAAAAAGDGQAGHHAALRECLSLHLAALQLLEHALEGQAAAVAAAAEDQALVAGDAESAGPADLAAAADELQADAAASMEAVEEAAAALDKAGQEPSPTAVTPAAAAVAAAEASLPDPWELLYAAALAWGREAAVDELLGNQARSCRLYARAGTALSFLCSEAPGLELEPPAELAPADRARLQKYAAATAARWAACAAAAAASADGGEGLGGHV
ncbi:Serine threonine- kinase ATG1 [Chlorella sorokiniana]|uniref:Serine threonine-kinase ATG1 n=1 Tax=Chlorella sorokiniana TaxID=3076 RepID=A0A2P6U1R4_CHLSO|nr:Serine threonine- kinase ATG1 [Chlorella sorokiniana]|eukprot:PRW60240.1 Serine threonine- kinase ATG1 [Chlorella sorokiniana]